MHSRPNSRKHAAPFKPLIARYHRIRCVYTGNSSRGQRAFHGLPFHRALVISLRERNSRTEKEVRFALSLPLPSSERKLFLPLSRTIDSGSRATRLIDGQLTVQREMLINNQRKLGSDHDYALILISGRVFDQFAPRAKREIASQSSCSHHVLMKCLKAQSNFGFLSTVASLTA